MSMRIRRGVFALVALVSFTMCAPQVLHAAAGQNAPGEGQQGKNEDEKVYEPGPGISAPRATYAPQPSYTDKARKAKTSGTVVLQLIVTPEGTVRDLHVIKSLTPDLDNQAVSVVQTWKFEPAKKDGQPVAVQIKVEADFRIR